MFPLVGHEMFFRAWRNSLLIGMLALPWAVCAQDARPNVRHQHVTMWGAGSFGNGHVFGYSQNRQLDLAGFNWALPVWNRKRFVLKYRMDAIPAAFLRDERFMATWQPVPGVKDWIYGAGFNPVGAEMIFPTHGRLQPFADVTGGFLYFRRKVLEYDGTRFNFTIATGFGSHVFVSRTNAITFGYRYHHLSNANIHKNNPGVDSHLVYGGWSMFLD